MKLNYNKSILILLLLSFISLVTCTKNNVKSKIIIDDIYKEFLVSSHGEQILLPYEIDGILKGEEIKFISSESWVCDFFTENGNIIFSVLENKSEESRSANLNIKYNGASFTIKINQNSKNQKDIKLKLGFVNYRAIGLEYIYPEDKDQKYLIALVEKSQIDEAGGVNNYAHTFHEDYMNDPQNNDYSSLCFVGDIIPKYSNFKLGKWWQNCKSDTDYMILSFYTDDEFNVLSEVFTNIVTTSVVPDSIPYDLSFNILSRTEEYVEIEFPGLQNLLSDDELNDPPMDIYFQGVSGVTIIDATYFENGLSDVEIANKIIEFSQENFVKPLGSITLYGLCKHSNPEKYRYNMYCMPQFIPEREYIIASFGVWEGSITTDIFIQRIIASAEN